MKKIISRVAFCGLSVLFGTLFCYNGMTFAEGESEMSEAEQIQAAATSIGISPVNKILQLMPDTTYEDVLKVTNNGSSVMEFEMYAAPYSYTYSESDDSYHLGFANANNFTQISRWITFKDADGNYAEKVRLQAEPGSATQVTYRITTPSDIPGGGQYAVIFAHTLSNNVTSSGIKTEASPGLVLYGRSNGETITTAEMRDLAINRTVDKGDEKSTLINASAKVKNTGNVDFMAQGTLKVMGIFGQTYYETDNKHGRISIIPETELPVTDTWEETPYFGLFNVSWTVTAAGSTETISQMVLLLPMPILIGAILLLTIIIIWIIIFIRKRKERRSRFMI